MTDIAVIPKGEKLGFENLKKAIIEGIEVGQVTADRLKDGWQWGDIFPIGAELKDMGFVFINSKQIIAEYEDLDLEEIEDLVIAVVEKFGVTQVLAVNMIKSLLDFIRAGYNFYVNLMAYINRKK
jgi:hypothetical protein